MALSDDRSPSERTLSGRLPASETETTRTQRPLHFLPDDCLTEDGLRAALDTGSASERLRLLSHIVTYAPWDDIWTYVEPDELLSLLPELELPVSMAEAWRRYLDH